MSSPLTSFHPRFTVHQAIEEASEGNSSYSVTVTARQAGATGDAAGTRRTEEKTEVVLGATLVVTSATLVVTGASLVVTRSRGSSSIVWVLETFCVSIPQIPVGYWDVWVLKEMDSTTWIF